MYDPQAACPKASLQGPNIINLSSLFACVCLSVCLLNNSVCLRICLSVCLQGPNLLNHSVRLCICLSVRKVSCPFSHTPHLELTPDQVEKKQACFPVKKPVCEKTKKMHCIRVPKTTCKKVFFIILIIMIVVFKSSIINLIATIIISQIFITKNIIVTTKGPRPTLLDSTNLTSAGSGRQVPV